MSNKIIGRIAGATVAAALALTAPAIATTMAAQANAEGGFDFNLDLGDPATVVLPTQVKSAPGLFARNVAFLPIGTPVSVAHECTKVTWCKMFSAGGVVGWVPGATIIRN